MNMNQLLFSLYLLLLATTGFAQKMKTQDSVQARIILVGDGGAFRNGKHPVVAAIKKMFELDKKTTIVTWATTCTSMACPTMQT